MAKDIIPGDPTDELEGLLRKGILTDEILDAINKRVLEVIDQQAEESRRQLGALIDEYKGRLGTIESASAKNEVLGNLSMTLEELEKHMPKKSRIVKIYLKNRFETETPRAADLVRVTESELLKQDGVASKTVSRIKAALAEFDLYLGMKLSKEQQEELAKIRAKESKVQN